MKVEIPIKDYQLERFEKVINEGFSRFIKIEKVYKPKYYSSIWSDVTLIVDDDAIELLFCLGIDFATQITINREF